MPASRQCALVLVSCLFSCVWQYAYASQFLGVSPPRPAMLPLLEELERIIGTNSRASTESRADLIEDALRPTFHAMPKTSDGGVRPDAVRYMVHRYFVDRHGWFVDGLGAGSDASNSSSPSNIFKGQGDEVHELFEDRFSKHSFSLHQVAVFASALEGFVHKETMERLQAAYSLSMVPVEGATESDIQYVLEGYMVMYVLGSKYNEITPSHMRTLRARIAEVYPTWKETKKWADSVYEDVLRSRAADLSPTSFNFSVKVLEEIADRYGRWQNKECVDLKKSLLELEEAGSGRVPLETFYSSALQGNWQFSESIGYLRQLGAVDETDSRRPTVIIPNYVNAPSNCVASSKFYSVCCIDECEGLVAHLEKRIAAPEAPPQRIADLVANLPSPTVQTPRVLSASLLQKLEDIAAHHHGTVPFHGRLFAQWMHHAYPRECIYPHMAGKLTSLPPLEWQKHTGLDAAADESTMQAHIRNVKQATSLNEPSEVDELPWTTEEELFVSRLAPSKQASASRVWAFIKHVTALGATFSVALSLVRTFGTAKGAKLSRANEKCFV